MFGSKFTVSHLESLLQRCTTAAHIYQLHGFILTGGFHRDHLYLSKFVARCAALDLPDYAIIAARSHPIPSSLIYNAAIRVLSLRPSSAEKAALLYAHTHLAGVLRPDAYSFPPALKAAASLRDVGIGKQIHGQAVKVGLDGRLHTATTLIQMYADCECIESARLMFDKMPQRNVVSWTALISGYVHLNKPMEAIELFRKMQAEAVEMDEVVMLAVLSACADLGALELGEWICKYIDTHHGMKRTVHINNAVLDMYVKSGEIGKALDVFDRSEEYRRTVVTWTTMIAGLALHGFAMDAVEMFTRMEQAGVQPNEVTFLAILSACSHVGMVELGQYYFDKMSSVYRVKPRIEHYGCTVALLGRVGHLQEAEDLVKKMPFQANAAIWGSLLAAAKIHGNVELATRAALCLERLEPSNSGNYSLLSNAYSAYGRWDEAGIARKNMKEAGVKKVQGWSSIEIGNRFNVFGSGDVPTFGGNVVYEVVEQINKEAKKAESTEMELLMAN